MGRQSEVLTDKQMREQYGVFYAKSPKVAFDHENVPPSLESLIPYAEFWGISDDGVREALIEEAPRDVQHNLKTVVNSFNDELNEWLAGDESHSRRPSKAYLAFVNMVMAADYV